MTGTPKNLFFTRYPVQCFFKLDVFRVGFVLRSLVFVFSRPLGLFHHHPPASSIRFPDIAPGESPWNLGGSHSSSLEVHAPAGAIHEPHQPTSTTDR